VRQYQLGEREQFFDLAHDPDERHNLIREPQHRAEIDRLRKLLLAHMERTDDPQLPAFRKTLAAP
jgi:hypothetical protein